MPVPQVTRAALGFVIRAHRSERGLTIEGLADLAQALEVRASALMAEAEDNAA